MNDTVSEDIPDRTKELIAGSFRLTPLRIALLLALITLAVFLPVSGYDFVNYDDEHYIPLHPPVLQGITLGGIAEHKKPLQPLCLSLIHI